jgi:hypothetical protein
MELITTPNPNAKKIEIEHGLNVGTVVNSADDIENSLFSSLLGISGVTSIFIGPGFLTISKEAEIEWDSINNDIVAQFDKL